jgi:hypothetical protein
MEIEGLAYLLSFETRKSLVTPGEGEQLQQHIEYFQHNQIVLRP